MYRRQNQKGYTLVELMVVLAIVGILIGVGIAGIVGYQRYAHFKQNNEYAQTIYTAAQTSFTHAEASGELEDLEREMAKGLYSDNAFDLGMITNGVTVAETRSESDRLYYLTFKKGDNKENYSGAYQMVYDMVASYVYDATILDATFCVEFDPVDGIILGVCYDDTAEDFTYSGTGSDTVDNISDRSSDARKPQLLGYYGADTLSARMPETIGRNTIKECELVNDETLHLEWQLQSRYTSYATSLGYEVKLYNADSTATSQELMSIIIEPGQIKAKTATNKRQLQVNCMVTVTKNGKETTYNNQKFPAYAQNNVLYLDLDAVDRSVAGERAVENTTSLTNAQKAFGSSYSIQRFGLTSNQNLTAKVRTVTMQGGKGRWSGYTSKQNTMFGNKDLKSGDAYEIANARHLFNLRYVENATDKNDDVSYQQTADFNWSGENSILANQNVYSAQNPDIDPELIYSFKSISSLGRNHVYDGADYEIGGLVILPNNENNQVQANLLGLFGTNEGAIRNVTLDNIRVLGGEEVDYVGGVCGANDGQLENVAVTGDSLVTGHDYVGGITGSDASTKWFGDWIGALFDYAREARTYIGLTNQAEVSGSSYVGGISGYMLGTQVIRPSLFTETVALQLDSCVNTGYVHGDTQYVGGIIGYNGSSDITNCVSIPTLSEEYLADLMQDTSQVGVTSEIMTAVRAGELGQYVGGIVGYNEEGDISGCSTGNARTRGFVIGSTYVGGIAGKDERGTFEGTGMANYAYVIGKQYVGGIIGQNVSNVTLSGWTNYGMATATESYSGGIAGSNSGTIQNCTTQVDTNTTTGQTYLNSLRLWGRDGNYSGGITGSNSGTILNCQNVSCVQYGHDFVGGIAGYNDTNGNIAGSDVDGGYVQGNNFVGGYVGANLSQNLLSKELVVRPNQVEGNDYVGGAIGANILNSSLAAFNLQVDNFLGRVQGAKYVGGLVGYNILVNSNGNIANCLTQLQSNNVAGADTYASSSRTLTIGTATDTTLRLASVIGQRYVGGVLGYNAGQTRLIIQNIINNTNVTATSYVEQSGKNYSYVGGIIGLVNENTIVSHCSNASSAKVSGRGTYTGGIAERSFGRIQNCTVTSLGSSTTDYVGGIVGRNDLGGVVTSSGVTGTVTGRSYVGGISAENYGTISGRSGTGGNVNGSGDYIGGAAGSNAGTIQDITVSTSIYATGNNVGGIAGYNAGELSNCNITTGVTIRGGQYVGGFIGEQNGSNLTGLNNHANVVATRGYAGGIVGHISGHGNIISCKNDGNVTAQQGNAGGITAENMAAISQCESTGTVRAANGEAGGITAVNRYTAGVAASITNPVVTGTIVGRTYTGAVAARNYGVIMGAHISTVDMSNVSGTVKSWIGGITGKNESTGFISDSTAGTAANRLSVQATVTGSNAGGVTGENAGMINGGTGSVVYADVMVASNSRASANLGGIVGYNAIGNIENYTFTGTVSGNKGSEYGYGGIAGYNASGAGVVDCRVVDSQISATGDASDMANVGGIVGYNAQAAQTIHSFIEKTTVSTAGTARLGGIVGYNNGTVGAVSSEQNGDTYTDQDSIIQINTGHVGGIVGYNAENGSVIYCTNNAKVTATGHQTDNGIGGIIGYNCSAKDILNDTNTASITKNSGNAVGGLIGRQETQASSSYRIANCSNSGAVTGYERVAGLIGCWKYQGGHIENCENSGVIRATNQIAGGIAADVYEMTGGSAVYFENCMNHGWINTGSNAGGVLGRASMLTSGSVIIQMNRCVNTGIIGATNAATSSGGIAGNIAGNVAKTTIFRCRNYGTSLTVNTSFGGIISTTGGNNNILIEQCFGVVNNPNSTPITKATSDQVNNSYYFVNEDAGDDPSRFCISAVNLVGGTATSTEGALQYVYDGVIDSDKEYISWKMSTKGTGIVELELSKEVDLGELEIFWRAGAGGENRTFNYSVKYSDSEGNWINSNAVNVHSTTYVNKPNLATDQPTTTNMSGIKTKALQIDISGNSTNSNYISFWEIRVKDKDGNYASPIQTSTKVEGRGIQMAVYPDGNGAYKALATDGAVIETLSQNPVIVTDTTTSIPNERKSLYEEIDSQLIAVYTDPMGTEKLASPSNVKLQSKNGYYEVSWNENQLAYYHEVKIYIYNDATGDSLFDEKTLIVGNGSTLRIDVEDEWSGKYIAASVQAKSADESLDSDIVLANNGERQQIAEFLPVPQIHYELQGTSDYLPILENAEDYDNTDIIVLAYDTTEKRVSVEELVKNATSYAYEGDTRNVIFKVHAESSSKGNSKMVSSQSCVLRTNYLKNDTTASIDSKKGFTGITPEALTYALTLKPNSVEIYYRSELLMEDPTFGMVAVSSALARVTATNSTGSSVSMANLPTSVTNPNQKVWVRSYPWSSQSDVAFYSWIYQSNVTAEQIKGDQKIYEDHAVRAGYSIEQIGNDETTGEMIYNVIYSPILANSTIGEGGSTSGYYAKQVLCSGTWPITKISTASTPKIEPIAEHVEEGVTKYTFTWDKEIEKNAQYAVTVTGTPVDGSELVEVYASDRLTEHSVTVGESDWRYKQLTLKVTHLGTEGIDGFTTTFGASSSETFDIKVELPSVAGVDVQLVDKDNLNYTVTWNQIAKESDEDTDFDTDFVGYQIQVTDQNGSVVTYPNGEELISKESNSQVLDLDTYQGNSVHISVVAKTGNTAKVYKDAQPGDAYELEVPTRLEKPAVSGDILKLDKVPTDIMSVSDFENNGVTVTMTGSASYQLRAAIYTDANKTTKVYPADSEALVASMENGSYQINQLSADYAGYYIAARVRSVSNSDISSYWSDEVIMQLPKVQLDVADMTESQVTEKSTESDVTTELDNQTSSHTQEKEIAHDAIVWSPVHYARSYALNLKAESEIYNLQINQSEDRNREPQITIESPEVDEKGQRIWKELGYTKETTAVGNIQTLIYRYPMEVKYNDDNNVEQTYGYHREISGNDVGETEVTTSYTIPVQGYLEYVIRTNEVSGNKEYSYRLVLPDITGTLGMNQVYNQAYRYTSDVQLVAKPAETDARYVISKIRRWYRTMDYGNPITKIETVEE